MQLKKYFTAPFAALLLMGASLANAAVPIDETWNPSAVPGLTTTLPFTFDNMVISQYSAIDINGTNFTDSGFINLAFFSNNGVPTGVPQAGLPGSGTPYSLYMSFAAAGVQTAGVPATGSFTAMSYTLLAAPGVTMFVDSNTDGIFEVVGAPAVTLATGSLLGPGSVSLTGSPGNLLPAASLTATFVPNPAFAGFFVSPTASQIQALSAAFTNTGSVISTFNLSGGVTRLSVNGGGGNATFATIPEPDTYGMLLAGLGLFGFIARRRKQKIA